MRILWWFLVLCCTASICILIVGLLKANITTIGTGAILTGLSVILMWGCDGYMNTGRWFGE